MSETQASSESVRADAAEQPTPAVNEFYPQNSRSMLFVVSGPSGAGKDSIVDGLAQRGVVFYRAITAVTRDPRPTERHGAHHYFLTPAEFSRWETEGRFLETALVYGHRYGTPLHEVKTALDRGQDVLLRVDVQGAASIRRRMPESVHIFIGVPDLSLETLQERRGLRGAETPAESATRDALLLEELAAIPQFDYYVVNQTGHIDRAISQVSAIITAEKCRISPRG